jgi:pimeloyl-ACP methyl ester carboxylesterase
LAVIATRLLRQRYFPYSLVLAVAATGYHAVAPDWRGYELSDQPLEAEAASYDDLQQDFLALLDAFSIPKVVYPALILGHFWGN